MNFLRKSVFAVVILFFGISAFAQTDITKGERVCIDGTMEKGEWDDADVFVFASTAHVSSKVYLKHDGQHLLIAYVNENIRDETFLFPEIFIDSKCNKGKSWQPDDYWFHVSAQDCYAIGRRENYDRCRPDYSVWRASPNYPFGKAYEPIGAFEIAIPFALLGVEAGDTIGICFSQAIMPYSERINYPHAAHEDIPESWKEFIISDTGGNQTGLSCFRLFMGKKWIGEYVDEKDSSLEHMISWRYGLNRHVVIETKTVPQVGFEMETTYYLDYSDNRISYYSVGNKDFISKGKVLVHGEDRLELVGKTFYKNEIQTNRKIFEITPEGKLSDTFFSRKGDEWVRGHTIRYSRKDKGSGKVKGD